MHTQKILKNWKSFNEQLEILKARGLVVDDENKTLIYLKMIGYYRLSGYLYSFRQPNPDGSKNRLDNFIENSRFEDVRKLYLFDKKLRQLALDALERIEIALRVNISYLLGKYAPNAHLDNQYFSNSQEHEKWKSKYNELVQRENKSSFVEHNLKIYGELPVWAGCEVWDFGTMSRLYKIMLPTDKDRIAKIYHLPSGEHLQNHLHAFNFIRNVAAHHGRLWNRSVIFKAKLKGLKDERFQQISPTQVFVYFCLMKRMLDVLCPNSTWGSRFLAVLKEFPQVENQTVSLKQMGITLDFKDWKLWYPNESP